MEYNIYRHGDVILRQVKSVPTDAIEKQRGNVVLAEGEITGHCHRIESPAAALLEREMARYLVLSDTCQLRHEEHKALQIGPGCYEIIIEREWDYIEQHRKKVVD